MSQVRVLDEAGIIRTGQLRDDTVILDGETVELDAVTFLPPCEPTTLVGVAHNYVDALKESGKNATERPVLFLKPKNAVTAHRETVTPRIEPGDVYFEGELAAVIGERCRHTSKEDAREVIAGYTCANDITYDGDENIVRRKAFDDSCPVGPALVSPNKVASDAIIEVRVNDEVRQRSALDQLVFPVLELIAEITSFITLGPGDVILTGTPAGRGVLADGDSVAVDISGVGTLTHDVDLTYHQYLAKLSG